MVLIPQLLPLQKNLPSLLKKKSNLQLNQKKLSLSLSLNLNLKRKTLSLKKKLLRFKSQKLHPKKLSPNQLNLFSSR